MNKSIGDYLNFLSLKSECIKATVERASEYWFPGSPPTVLLFSQIGKVLATQFYSLNENEREEIFQHIESGICSEKDELATAVATGLVESLVTASDENDELWEGIEYYLQSESKKHALAWKNFGQ